jgi:quinol monooxygenase YgiN
MSDTILVTGYFDIDPAQREAAAAAAIALMEATRAEDGCVRYDYSEAFDRPGRIHVSEEWTSPSAMDAHMTSPHFTAFMGAVGGFGVTGASLTKWEGGTPSKLF